MAEESGVVQTAKEPTGFTPITTQEQFDSMIRDRIERARNSAKAEFSDYEDLKAAKKELDELKQAQMTDLEKANSRAEAAETELAKLKAENQRSAWAQAASEKYGVPANLLRGSTEKEIGEHAKQLAEAFKPGKPRVGSDGGRAETPGGTGDWLRDMFFGE